MNEPVCIVTGGTSGIGRATARALARRGAKLYLLGRNKSAGTQLARTIEQAHGAGSATFFGCDLSDFTQVRVVAASIADHCDRIDVLVNNAGARNDHFATTPTGLERTFATNHLGHFLLTSLLLDHLLAASAARVISVSSGAHVSARPGDDWQFSAANYDRRQAYARSKLANVMFAFSLAERLSATRVTSNALAPGGVASRFARNNGLASWLRHLLSHALKRELISPTTAARSIIRLALAPDLGEVNACYFDRDSESHASAIAYDLGARAHLWRISVASTGLNKSNCSRWDLVHP